MVVEILVNSFYLTPAICTLSGSKTGKSGCITLFNRYRKPYIQRMTINKNLLKS